MANDLASAAAAAAAAARRRAEEEARRRAAAAAAAKAAAAKAAAAAAAKAATKKPSGAAAAKFKKDEFSTGQAKALRLKALSASPVPVAPTQAKAPTTAAQVKAADGTPPKDGAFPKTPAELAALSADAKKLSPPELKKAFDSLVTLKNGATNEKLTALSDLSKSFPTGLDTVLTKVGISGETAVGKLARDPEVLKNLGTLTDPKATAADKAGAAIGLANSVGTAIAPKDLQGFLNVALKGLPAGQKLAEAIGTFTDPDASAVDKAAAAVELATSVKEMAGSAFPRLADGLSKLDGPLSAVSSALTLIDPKASAKDKVIAAAQLAAEVPGLKDDVEGFKSFCKTVGIKDFQPVDDLVKLGGNALKGLKPELIKSLSDAQLATLEKLAANKDLADVLPRVLQRLDDPKVLATLVDHLGSADAATAKAMAETLGGLEADTMKAVLDKPETLELLGKVLDKLPEDARGTLASMVSRFDEGALGRLLEIGDKADGEALGKLVELGDKVDSKMLGEGLKLIGGLLDKMGVKVTAEAAGKLLENVGKMVPLLGAVPAAYDAGRLALEAANTNLPPDLRFFAMTGAAVNGADVLAAVADATGVVDEVGVPVQVALGITELAIDIGFDTEKAKWQADPKNYHAPGWMRAVNVAVAAAEGPAGAAQFVAIYGAEGTAQVVQDGIKAGAKGAIELGKDTGIAGADVAGADLHATGQTLHLLADVIRNPDKYGAAAEQLVKDASSQINDVIARGGQLAQQATQELGQAIDAAKQLGEKGLDTLKWIATNPGPAAQLAVNGIKSVITSATNLATEAGQAVLKKGVETLQALQDGWKNLSGAAAAKAQELIKSAGSAIEAGLNTAVSMGEKAVGLVAWAATHPGEAAKAAQQKLQDIMAAGGQLAHQAWDEVVKLGGDAQALAKNVITGLQAAGAKAVDTLSYIAEHPGDAALQAEQWVSQTFNKLIRAGGEAAQKAAQAVKDFVDRRVDWAIDTATDLLKDGVGAFNDVAKAWADNLTSGGKDVLSGLADLGDAGAGALANLAKHGGDLAKEAIGHLNDLAKEGSDIAHAALKGLSDLEGEVGHLAGDVIGGLGHLFGLG